MVLRGEVLEGAEVDEHTAPHHEGQGGVPTISADEVEETNDARRVTHSGESQTDAGDEAANQRECEGGVGHGGHRGFFGGLAAQDEV